MTTLLARDALSDQVQSVVADQRWSRGEQDEPQTTLFAVFAKDESTGEASDDFLGLVSRSEAALYPQRIFADLLPRRQPVTVTAETPLNEIRAKVAAANPLSLAVVDSAGKFVGAITNESFLVALLREDEFELAELEKSLDSQRQQRQLIAYEIHDGLVQYATAARMHLEAFRHRIGALDEASQEQFDRGMDLLKEAIAEARRLINGLNPPALEESGLQAAIRSLVDENVSTHGPAISFSTRGHIPTLTKPAEIALYRICQEALTNAVRHSHSSCIYVQLEASPNCVRLEIRDEGEGFATSAASTGHGLRGMQERAKLLGASFSLTSSLGEGTSVVVVLPTTSEVKTSSAGMC